MSLARRKRQLLFAEAQRMGGDDRTLTALSYRALRAIDRWCSALQAVAGRRMTMDELGAAYAEEFGHDPDVIIAGARQVANRLGAR